MYQCWVKCAPRCNTAPRKYLGKVSEALNFMEMYENYACLMRSEKYFTDMESRVSFPNFYCGVHQKSLLVTDIYDDGTPQEAFSFSHPYIRHNLPSDIDAPPLITTKSKHKKVQ